MHIGILGKKVGMTQFFTEAGMMVPVTVIDTTGCQITQVKTKGQGKDGYCALQLGIGTRKPQNVTKTSAGHYKKASVAAKTDLQEFRLCGETDMASFKSGQTLTPSMFTVGDKVDVIGITKGKGFTGVMKRYGYKGKHATHGTSKYFRHGGSNGSNTFPGRVLKNKGMPGQEGNTKRTVTNVQVVAVHPEENLILVRGGIPGPKGGVLMVRSAIKRKAPENRTWVAA